MSLHEIDLAQKISDKIICVKGDAISHFGAPETIFREDIIRELYEIDKALKRRDGCVFLVNCELAEQGLPLLGSNFEE